MRWICSNVSAGNETLMMKPLMATWAFSGTRPYRRNAIPISMQANNRMMLLIFVTPAAWAVKADEPAVRVLQLWQRHARCERTRRRRFLRARTATAVLREHNHKR